MRPKDRLTVINQGSTYSFVPSNPWIAVGWRDREGQAGASCFGSAYEFAFILDTALRNARRALTPAFWGGEIERLLEYLGLHGFLWSMRSKSRTRFSNSVHGQLSMVSY